jgi:hypothetical protein
MKTLKIAAGLVLAAGLVAAMAVPADAQSRRRYIERPIEQPTQTIYYTSSGRRVVVVRPRSYLDAGTEVNRGERRYMDYAYPQTYSAYPDRTDWKGSWYRMPFPDCFDLASFCN